MKKDVFELPINALHDLEACSFMKKPDCASCTQDGPGFGFACRDTIRIHAIDAIKALIEHIKEMETPQEAKALSVEEAARNAYSFYHTPDSVKPVFVQFRDETYSDEAMTPPWRGGVNQRALLKEPDRYGKDFVFWTDRPSEEQMEGVEWDGI